MGGPKSQITVRSLDGVNVRWWRWWWCGAEVCPVV